MQKKHAHAELIYISQTACGRITKPVFVKPDWTRKLKAYVGVGVVIEAAHGWRCLCVMVINDSFIILTELPTGKTHATKAVYHLPPHPERCYIQCHHLVISLQLH